jgi:thiamine biosynthesis lipoprotein
MKNKILISTIVLLTIFSCKERKFEYVKLEGYAQGTTYHITYENSANRNFSFQIDSILKAFDLSLSEYIPQSIISRINANDTSVETDDLFRTVFNKAQEVNKNSDGAFDITVGPLVEAWGFGPKGKLTNSKSHIDSLLKYVGMDKVKIVGKKLIKKYPQVSIDVNALAQGFSVDVVCKFLDSYRINNYVVEIGGELKTKGKNVKGEKWQVGIDKPVDGSNKTNEQLQAIISLSDKAIATSGDYRKFFVEDGKKYAHHIDPHTGNPAKQNILSASIIADECITADAYGTACMVLGLEKSIKLLSKHKDLEAYLIYTDEKGKFCEYVTKGARKIIKR